MTEESKNIWKQPLTGKRKWLAWFALLAMLLFLIGFVGEGNGSSSRSVLVLLMFAAVGSAMVLWLVWFIRWLCCWRNLRRFLIGVACLITLIALAYVEENLRGRRAWEAHKRQWEAKGEKFTLAQLVPPPVPDDQNFALTPLLKPLFDYTRGPEGLVPRDPNGLARVEGIAVELDDKSKTNGLALGHLEKGTFADLAVCRKFYRGHTNYPQPAVPGAAATDILVALGKFDREIKELREAAATRPYCRFPIEYDCEPSWSILVRHLSVVKRLCQVTHVRALARLELGQSPEAFEDLKLGLRVSDSIRDEPILIDHLVRISTLFYNLLTLREGLIRHAWSDAQLTEIEKNLASVDLLAEYKLAMRGERVGSTSSLDWLRRQGFRAGPDYYDVATGENSGFPKYLVVFMPGGWFNQNRVTISQMFQEFNLPMVDEKAHRVFADVIEKSDAAMDKLSQRTGPYNLFARILMPALSKSALKSARNQTYVDAARVACALERYRLANGKLPETLSALTPRFIESIPTDVFDGKPLRYQLKADGGYIVYSVGSNQTDEGGEIVWKKSPGPNVDFTRGDWVWQMPVKPITAAELAQMH